MRRAPSDSWIKAGVHAKAVLTIKCFKSKQPERCLSANISVTCQATLNLYAHFIDHCLAVLCKFLGDFWAFWERDIFSHRIG